MWQRCTEQGYMMVYKEKYILVSGPRIKSHKGRRHRTIAKCPLLLVVNITFKEAAIKV